MSEAAKRGREGGGAIVSTSGPAGLAIPERPSAALKPAPPEGDGLDRIMTAIVTAATTTEGGRRWHRRRRLVEQVMRHLHGQEMTRRVRPARRPGPQESIITNRIGVWIECMGAPEVVDGDQAFLYSMSARETHRGAARRFYEDLMLDPPWSRARN